LKRKVNFALINFILKKIGIINGPNLNLLGIREPDVYGHTTFEDYFKDLLIMLDGRAELLYFQSNVEGLMIDKIHEWGFKLDGIILNAGGYSHSSISIADAVKSVPAKVVGVHISNIYNREKDRHTDLLQGACEGNISGLGLDGYRLAVLFLAGL
jgi:3-dehydroquinate dehydratase-2